MATKRKASWAEEAAASASVEAGAVAVDRCAGDGHDVRSSVPEIPGLRSQLVCPGDVVTVEPGALRGRGIMEREDGKLVATTCGVVERLNKLLYIRPLKHRYTGSVGDVIVGRIVEVQTERWAVEIGTNMLASLHLGTIVLPNHVQRRRTDEDALRMREFFEEGDLISAEIQGIQGGETVALQTRNARYGKLHNGVLAQVPAVYVRRQAQHFITLPNIGVQVVMGNNGWIWICAPPKVVGSGRQETINFSQMDVKYEKVGKDLRERIGRVRNAVMALASHGLEVTPESITFVYEQSSLKGLAAWELLDEARAEGILEAIVAEAVSAAEARGA